MRPPFLGDAAQVAPVTLVVAVHNDAPQLSALLLAIEEQVVGPAEFLVADRGSTDGTTQLLNVWSPPLPLSFKFVDAPGTSVAEARNLAIESASYELIVVTEAAALPDPDWIARLWAALTSGAEAASGRVLPTGSDPMERAIALVRMPASQPPGRPLACGVNLAFTRSVWDDVGGYPEWLEAGHDEVFAAALRGVGTTIVDVPDAVVSWSPGQKPGAFAVGSFRTGEALGQAGIIRTPGATGVANAGALLACACVRRSLGAVMAGAIVVRSGEPLRSVWRYRADSADPIDVRIVLTIGAPIVGRCHDDRRISGRTVRRAARDRPGEGPQRSP